MGRGAPVPPVYRRRRSPPVRNLFHSTGPAEGIDPSTVLAAVNVAIAILLVSAIAGLRRDTMAVELGLTFLTHDSDTGPTPAHTDAKKEGAVETAPDQTGTGASRDT